VRFRADHIDRLVAEVIEAAPDAIVASELPTRALQRLATTTPIVAMTENMVGAGLVTSLARPGGNTTGISLLSQELDGKRLEILMEAVPGIRRMAAVADSQITPTHHIESLQAAAHSRGIELRSLQSRSARRFCPRSTRRTHRAPMPLTS
jgi:putative tryptophan/tyrosine transport system substrate-binding protein